VFYKKYDEADDKIVNYAKWQARQIREEKKVQYGKYLSQHIRDWRSVERQIDSLINKS